MVKYIKDRGLPRSFNIEIMPEVKLGPEAQPRDANNRVALFILDT